MSRLFNDNLADHVDLGAISGADFLSNAAWSYLTFFRSEGATASAQATIAKWTSGSNRNILIRIESGAFPRNIDVWMNATQRIQGGSTNVQANTWYLLAVTNDGTGSVGTLQMSLVEMDGTFLDDAVSGDPALEDEIAASIFIGRMTGAFYPFDGDIAHTIYVDKVVSKQEISSFLYGPARQAAAWVSDGVQFYLPLGYGSPEPDWSGSGNNGTIVGSPVIGDNPPVGPLFGFDQVLPTAVVAAAGKRRMGVIAKAIETIVEITSPAVLTLGFGLTWIINRRNKLMGRPK